MTGTAAGVPFTALPPADNGAAPLIVTWHMLDAPRSNAAFAAALPMNDVSAWRVHLGMLCGARMVDGSTDAIVNLSAKDALMSVRSTGDRGVPGRAGVDPCAAAGR